MREQIFEWVDLHPHPLHHRSTDKVRSHMISLDFSWQRIQCLHQVSPIHMLPMQIKCMQV